MPNLTPILVKLLRAQSNFLRAADSISAASWNTPPAPNSWSTAEIVAHLCHIERYVIGTADRIIRHSPRPIPFHKRFRLPLFLVEVRIRRLKSPLPVDPELLAEKEAMLADLRGVRERTLAFLDETKSRDLTRYYWPHPFLGMFGFYTWMEMIASHQIRHTKQIHEIATTLPKHVVSS